MGRYLSARHILSLAKVVEAVEKNRQIRLTWNDGKVVFGELRGFTTHENELAPSTCPDMRDSWVRMTLRNGFGDIWIETEELAGFYEEGAVAL